MENFDCHNLAEFTIEAGRPDSITREKLMMIRNYPVTRISVNPQTMNQETLDIIGRRHTVQETEQAFPVSYTHLDVYKRQEERTQIIWMKL